MARLHACWPTRARPTLLSSSCCLAGTMTRRPPPNSPTAPTGRCPWCLQQAAPAANGWPLGQRSRHSRWHSRTAGQAIPSVEVHTPTLAPLKNRGRQAGRVRCVCIPLHTQMDRGRMHAIMHATQQGRQAGRQPGRRPPSPAPPSRKSTSGLVMHMGGLMRKTLPAGRDQVTLMRE